MKRRNSALRPEPLPAGGLLEMGQQVGKPLTTEGRERSAALIGALRGVDLATDPDHRLALAELRAERAERLLALLELERGEQIADQADRVADQLFALLELAAAEPAGCA
jgi:hypothetical protein